jgi:hypothetical protein
MPEIRAVVYHKIRGFRKKLSGMLSQNDGNEEAITITAGIFEHIDAVKPSSQTRAETN